MLSCCISIKEEAVAGATIEDEKFVHESVGSFFTLQGAMNNHCNNERIPWDDSIDDYA